MSTVGASTRKKSVDFYPFLEKYVTNECFVISKSIVVYHMYTLYNISMLKSLKKYLLYLVNYIAPERMDALVVKNLDREDILKLPKAPAVENMAWISGLFHYKNNATFNSILAILSELLGLSPPILVKDVMFSSSEIVIKVTDEYEAKQKFLSSINEVQKTLSIKRK